MAKAASTARRMTSEERRDQLADAAVAVVAQSGYTGLTLDAVAERAGVTRNLLYHYFPRGRRDLFLAAVERAGEELTGGWLTDDSVPLDERLAANFGRVIEHALAPSRAWLVHRQARLLGEPEAIELGARYRSLVVAAISLNHFGSEDPGPLARAALRSYLDYAERLLDECREGGLERGEVARVLSETLLAVVESARRTPG